MTAVGNLYLRASGRSAQHARPFPTSRHVQMLGCQIHERRVEMGTSHRNVVAALALAISVLASDVSAQPARIVGPDTVSFTSGALTLRGIIYRPAGDGPFPTILFNHGSATSYTKEVEAVGPSYAGQGFVFFAPSRRGQWLSSATGQYIVDSLDAIEKVGGVEARGR